MPDPLSLSDRVAIVTGAGRGIGRAIAETLHRHGSSLVLSGRNEAALCAFSENLNSKRGGSAIVVAGDIAFPETVERIAKATFDEFKRLDILVNNAGILGEGVIGMIKADAIDQALETNLRSTLLCIQAGARLMRRGGAGSIINLSSIMGRFGSAGLMAYSASKAGIIGASLAAAKELAPAGIRVNVIAPGVIESDMTAGMSEAVRKKRLDAISMQRIGQPQDVADVALFLASDLSSYVTGQVLGVDGGMIV